MARTAGVFRTVGMLVLAAGIATGCGGGSDGGQEAPETSKVKVSDDGAEGEIVVCMGKDTSGIHGPVLEQFNEENEGAEARLVELPESADEQRTQLVQRLRAKSDECDVLALDVVWTAEFAAQGWLADVGGIIEEREGDFIESTLETARYDDTLYAVPFNSNAGFIYYRTDQVDEMPDTWQALYDKAAETNGHVYQGSRYEGLTVHFLELLYAAGGELLNEDGTEATADTEEVREVLQFMVDGIKEGAVPRATLTYKEEEARRAFESGRATFMRNWPYAYTLGQEAAAVRGKFEVAPFPSWEGGDAASVLGGYNLAVSEYSDNPDGAAALIDYLTSEEAQTTYAEAATPPVLTDVYEAESVKEALPFAEELRSAIEQGRSRPVSPVYPQISEAISTNVYEALSGEQAVDEAAKSMQADIEKALETF